MKNLLPLSIACLAILLSCGREYKRLDFELTVRDKVTGLPVKTSVCVSYRPYSGQDTRFEKYLASTDIYGVLKYNEKQEDKMFGAELVLYADGYGSPGMGAARRSVSVGGKHHKYEMEVSPYYYVLLELRNTNCFDETDSVWATFEPYPGQLLTKTFTGCGDSTFVANQFNNYTYWVRNNPLIYTVKVKRNGQVSEFQRAVTFDYAGQKKDVLIEY